MPRRPRYPITEINGLPHKECARCHQVIPLAEFPIISQRTGKINCLCRPCKNAAQLEYLSRPGNLERRKAQRAISRTSGREGEYIKGWRAKNRERMRLQHAAWCDKNRERLNNWRRPYSRQRYAEDLGHRLMRILRRRLNHATRAVGKTKDCHAIELVGCDLATLKAHLESLWKPGMSWENYGHDTWHIDHIRPCSSFDLSDPEQQRQCFHYKNLQPLWSEENLRKSNSWDGGSVAKQNQA